LVKEIILKQVLLYPGAAPRISRRGGQVEEK
jgi:hypothetical protein